MGKQKWRFYLTICLHLIQLSFYNCQSQRNDINDYISSLNYNSDDTLKGETLVSAAKTEGTLDESNNFHIVKRVKKIISSKRSELGLISGWENVTYPGSLLVANYNLVESSPDLVEIERAPQKYTVDLPGLTDNEMFTIKPSFINYEVARNKVLSAWFEKYQQDVNVSIQTDSCLAFSKEQLRVQFGTEFKNTNIEFDIDFNAINKQEKLIMIHRFKQIFYTVNAEPSEKPADLFGAGVTLQDLAGKFDGRNPPVMVENVSYGRVIYLKIETSSTDKAARFILENKLTKFNSNVSHDVDKYSKQLKNLTMQVYVMGTDNNHFEQENVQNIEDVNDVIIKYGKFSSNNTGYPVSYACRFIKDNSRVVVNSKAEYIENIRIVIKPGTITLRHVGQGWFVSKWIVEWDEITYDENGNEVANHILWKKNGKEYKAPYTREIQLKGNVKNIRVCAKGRGGFIFEWERTIFDRSDIPLVKNREFSVWGLMLNPQYSIEPPE